MSSIAECLRELAVALRAHAVALDEEAAAIAQLAAEIEAAVAPAPAPAPAPEPAPPPPVEPAELVTEMLDLRRIVALGGWHSSGSNYERYQRLTAIDPAAETRIDGWRGDLSNGNDNYRPARTYTLLADGVEIAAVAVPEGAASWWWVLPAGTVAMVDWLKLSIGGLADGENCPTWFARVLGGPEPARMPVCTGSYDLSQARINGTHAEHAWGWVPTRYAPRSAPLPRQVGAYPPVAVGDTVRVDLLAPGDGGNRPAINVDQRGVVNTFARQAYFWDDATRKYPRVALLDGPRGVGTIVMPTHIGIGTGTQTADPASAPRNNLYVCDPWRFSRLDDDGHVTTLAGWRHRGLPSYWQDEPGGTLELVGDWSEIPEARRGFHELWGQAWLRYTLPVDTDAEPIPVEDNRQPHRNGPACLVTDSQNNRVCKVAFDPRSHATPAKVTEFAVLADPWDVVPWGEESVLVSERAAHRIVQLDARTGALQRIVIQRDPALPGDGKLSKSPRRMERSGSLAEAQAQPCLGPEGLYELDDWLYFGSFAQAQVRRVHLITGELQVVIAGGIIDGNSKFVKLAVSDGTFGPRGTVFVQTWSEGRDKSAFTGRLPDGSTWFVGKNDLWGTQGYGSAVAVGQGRLVFGSSHYGLSRYAAGPAADAKRFAAGLAEFKRLHGLQRWGMCAFGHYGQALPWGRSDALDYYLKACGHQP